MMERIISDECLESIRRSAYKAGKTGKAVYTSRGADGEEITRCRDCGKLGKRRLMLASRPFCKRFKLVMSDDNGFCAWPERKEGSEVNVRQEHRQMP